MNKVIDTQKADEALVSIIIPAYNISEYVTNSVKSAVLQTYKNVEVILVDDGSSDGTAEICDRLAGQYNNIHQIHKENGGLSSARNAGLNAAKGDFILFLDGDDYLAVNAVEYLINIQKKSGADIVEFRYKETGCDYCEELIFGTGEYITESHTKRFFEKLYEIGGEAASACTKFYKSKLFEELRYKEGIIHEDEYMITRLLDRVGSIAYIDETLYFYVQRQGSIINSSFKLSRLDTFFVSKDRIEYFKGKGYNDLYEYECRKYFSAAADLYCMARYVKNKEGCRTIIGILREYINTCPVKPIGRYGKIYSLCKMNAGFIYLYYLLRKYFGQI